MNYKKYPEGERDLIIGLRNGDHRAFSLLYAKYRPLLASFLRQMRIDSDTTEEITQAAFEKLWESRSRLMTDRPLQAYLFQIAKHRIYNEVRKNALKEKYIAHFASEIHATSPEGDHDLQELLHETMNRLSPRRQQVFRMSRIEGYSNQEIAEEMGLSKSTIENHINAALKEIRHQLEQNGYLSVLYLIYCVL